ncbi:MAG: hypothetical protein IJG13_02290, partial [Kiritimatiellae bacterium]|nr:hypothetical protein [Kiritimatiellia bacterium]
MNLEPINPLLYINPHDPLPEEVKEVSKWFKTETVELNFGEYVGRPDANITAHREMLTWYFSQGWYVDAVLSSKQGGKWESVASASASQNGTSSSKSESKNESAAKSQGGGETGASNYITRSDGPTTVLGTKSASSSEGQNSGTASASGNASSSASSSSTTTQDGGPYWYAYQRIRLKRRKMQSEAVLQDMITSFTKAYNEGREVNNARYDELVALYALMLRRTEDEANVFAGLTADDFKPLAKAVTDAVKDALENFKGSVGDLPADWMKSRIDEINRKFDALVGQAKAKMVSEGTFNSTVWPTTLSGIERDRQYALNDLKDGMVTAKIDAYGKIATITGDIGNKLLDCEIRIIEAQQKMLLGPTEVRNTVFKWMLDFMERRDDDYPGSTSSSQSPTG